MDHDRSGQFFEKIDQNESKELDGLKQSIFHANCIGSNLIAYFSVLENKLRQEGFIPDFLNKQQFQPFLSLWKMCAKKKGEYFF